MSQAGQARSSADARQRALVDVSKSGHGVASLRSVAPDDRRQDSRRKPRPNRTLAMPHSPEPGRHWFPRNWPYMITCMIGAIVSSAVATQRIPEPFGAALLGLSVV